MNKKTYLKSLNRHLRWRLPREEAEDVIGDYRELIDDHLQAEKGQKEEAAVLERLGKPASAARALGTSRDYLLWMSVFVLLCASLIYMILLVLVRNTDFEQFTFETRMDYVLFYLSVGLTAFWKGKGPKGEISSPKLRPALLGTAGFVLIPIGMGVFLLNILMAITIEEYVDFERWQWVTPVFKTVFILAGFLCFLAAAMGLVNSRIRERRWISVCALALIGLFLCTELLLYLCSLDNANTAIPFFSTLILPVGVGAAGVIWSLC